MRDRQKWSVQVPGKCLVLGGYLILEDGNRGVSLSLSARTRATLCVEERKDGNGRVEVTSPDLGGKWIYSIDNTSNVHIVEESEENAFLLCSLKRVLTLPSVTSCLLSKRLTIQMENRDGFYYQQNGKQHKTGFGTSSTTTAAFVCCLLLASCSIGIPLSSEDRELVATLAIQAHNEAQHRSGSGYDILTGVYGSCVVSVADSQLSHTPFSLPAGLAIVLSQGGGKSSSTPVLVKSLQAWRQCEGSEALWERYRQNNEALVDALVRAEEASLHRLYEERLEVMLELSHASGSGVLPDELFPVLKETMRIEGVVGCGVAGAGGFDSFYALVKKGEWRRDLVERLWSTHGYSLSGAHEDDGGMVVQLSLWRV